jgi:formate-dependent phosphoribosylglycinamide formyltransferase (GAR transformylase)
VSEVARALPRVGVCHRPGGAADLREIVTAARGLCEVVVLITEQAEGEFAGLAGVSRSLFETHALGHDPAAAVMGLELVGVTTFHDYELDLTDVLDAQVRGRTPPSVSAWDKLVQRRRLAEAGLTQVLAHAVDSPQDFEKQWRELGAPAVLKPRRAANGRAVAFVQSEADVREQLRGRADWSNLVLETRIPEVDREGWWCGLLSVETVSAGAAHHQVGVSDKLPVGLSAPTGTADQGLVLPTALSVEAVEEIRLYTSRVLAALGVDNRVTHTELQVTPYGFEVVEVNGRMAGHTARVFRLAGGEDLVRLVLRTAVGEPLGDLVQPSASAAGIFPLFADCDGEVRADVARRTVRALPNVVGVTDLAAFGAPKAASGHRAVNLTMSAPDRPTITSALDQLLCDLNALFAADGGLAPDLLSGANHATEGSRQEPMT